jgi:hypothetical protein
MIANFILEFGLYDHCLGDMVNCDTCVFRRIVPPKRLYQTSGSADESAPKG